MLKSVRTSHVVEASSGRRRVIFMGTLLSLEQIERKPKTDKAIKEEDQWVS